MGVLNSVIDDRKIDDPDEKRDLAKVPTSMTSWFAWYSGDPQISGPCEMDASRCG